MSESFGPTAETEAEETEAEQTEAEQTLRSVVESVQVVDVSAELQQIEGRFGIPASTFDDYVVFRPNSKWLALVKRSLELPQRPDFAGLGMPFLYPKMRYPRFTTAAAIKFGPLATRNIVDIEDAAIVRRIVALEVITLNTADHPLISGPGHVLLRHQGMFFGLANIRVGEPLWTLQGMLPKTWNEML